MYRVDFNVVLSLLWLLPIQEAKHRCSKALLIQSFVSYNRTNNADPTLISEGLLGGAITAGVLLAHEAGHLYAAKQVGAKLSVPYFIPSWQV